jgi:hypothetical protein
VVLVRLVTDDGAIQHRAVGLVALGLEANAASLKFQLTNQLQRCCIALADVVVFECDSGAVNLRALKDLNAEMADLPSDQRFARAVHYVRCLSHGMTNTANKLVDSCSVAGTILRGFKGLSFSVKAKRMFQSITGAKLPFQSENRWVYWHQMA